MSTKTLHRRAVLKGAGSIAIALPWLEIMGTARSAMAAAQPARRFLSVYTPGGTIGPSPTDSLGQWRPTGTETNFALSPILAPLEPVKDRVVIVDGLDMKSAVGEQLQSGMIAWLTGTPQGMSGSGYATGPSIDQILAKRLPAAGAVTSSLQMAVRWGTGKSRGAMTPMDVVNFADGPNFSPIAPAIDPVLIWKSLFGVLDDKQALRKSWDKSILDFVDRRYVTLSKRLGGQDRQRLEQHLEKIREIERNMASTGPALTTCGAPTLIDTSDYDPAAGVRSMYDPSFVDLPADRAIPKVGKLMLDMMVMAFACDLKAVGTMMWCDSQAEYTCPWLGLPQTHYFYENGGGYHPPELQKIYTWYATQHAYLLQQMAQVDMGGHSLLDESVVFFGTEVANPANHLKKDMPFLLAGGGGGLRGGRWLRYDHLPHNNLLVSILNLFGDPRATFGDPLYCTGPLTNLT